MKNIKFYPSVWQMSPYSLDLAAYLEAERERNLDLTLNNNQATQLKVAEMSLNINGFAVIDQQGNELKIDSFTGHDHLQLKGHRNGLYIKTREEVSLPAGNYASIRFYLKAWDNRFILNDFSIKEVFDQEFIDFDIRGGLKINSENTYTLKLRFDFKPYTLKGLGRLIKRQIMGKVKPKLAHSFAR